MLATPRIGWKPLGQLCHRLGTSLGAGIDLRTALKRESETGRPYQRKQLATVHQHVGNGASLAEAMANTGDYFPMLLKEMVRVGEESGRLGGMLLELARVYDDEVEAAIKRILSLIEPALILVMGLVISLLVISILMGILAVNDLAI